MAKINISALGALRKHIPEKRTVSIEDDKIVIFDFLEEKFEIPRSESRMSFVVNGQINTGTDFLKDGDSIVILKMGGAG